MNQNWTLLRADPLTHVRIVAVALVVGTLVGDSVNGVGGLALLAAGLTGRAVIANRPARNENARRGEAEIPRAPL